MVRDLTTIYRPEAEAIPPELVVNAYEDRARSAGEPDGPLPVWIALYTDLVFRLRAQACAARHAASGQVAYLYEFDHPLQAPGRGVPHTAEIPFVFGTFSDKFFAAKVGAGPDEAALSDFMLLAWARFAHEGDPGPNWVRATQRPGVNLLGGSDALLRPADAGSRGRAVWD